MMMATSVVDGEEDVSNGSEFSTSKQFAVAWSTSSTEKGIQSPACQLMSKAIPLRLGLD